jgi:BASS family bile acid:Na+ symporter
MSLDGAISVLVTITLVEMMVAIGLQVTLPELVNSLENWRLLGRAAVANYVVVPSMTVALLTIVDASPMVATGFLIIAVCPGAPFGPLFARIARGRCRSVNRINGYTSRVLGGDFAASTQGVAAVCITK